MAGQPRLEIGGHALPTGGGRGWGGGEGGALAVPPPSVCRRVPSPAPVPLVPPLYLQALLHENFMHADIICCPLFVAAHALLIAVLWYDYFYLREGLILTSAMLNLQVNEVVLVWYGAVPGVFIKCFWYQVYF